MKLNRERTVEQAVRKLSGVLNLDEIFSSYTEIANTKNVLSLENFSIDFVVQNATPLEKFQESLKIFEKQLLSGKEMKILDKYLSFKKHKGVLYPVISNNDNQHTLSIKFFHIDKLNQWMYDAIEEKLSKGIHIEVVKGIILTIQSKNLKVIFSEDYLGGSWVQQK